MILLDTNIVINMINNHDNKNWDLLSTEDVVICGIVVAELYRGIKNNKERKAVDLFVNSLDSLNPDVRDWIDIGLFIANLKKRGLTIPFQDAVIAFLAIKNNCNLLTDDKHFSLIFEVDNRIKLFC